ncbi:MAG: AI-2E family transporter [Candidatus Sumerlaeaceae bacterium]
MQFSLDRFYRINRRALIWLALFGLIYVLRDFFALIFVTFLLVSFTLPLVNYLVRNTRFPRKLVIVSVYLLMFAGLIGVVTYVVPRVVDEAASVASELRWRNVKQAMHDFANHNPKLKTLEGYINQMPLENWLGISRFESQAQGIFRSALVIAVATISTLLLSLLFAFLIVLDLTRLTEQVRKLERSRLHDFYEQTAAPVVRFAGVIASSFRAQAVIALANTLLTTVGFFALGLPKVALLAIVVFFFSFIPVLGVFISTTPAVLIAINVGGYALGIKVIGFVILVHLIEAYVLNPLIYGQHLKLNPVLVLIILYVGHHFFGLWGMLLGVPVAYYFIHYVFAIPLDPSAEVAPPRLRRKRVLKMAVSPALEPAADARPADEPASSMPQGTSGVQAQPGS